jgi:hypothetical protein
MPYQVDDATRHAMSGTELSRVRTELRLLLREHINQRLLASRAADICYAIKWVPVRGCPKRPINLVGNRFSVGLHRWVYFGQELAEKEPAVLRHARA